MNHKISKIINRPDKYYLSDKKLLSNLKICLENFIKIESFFNKIIFNKTEITGSHNSLISESSIINDSLNIDSSRSGKDESLSMSLNTDMVKTDSYKSAQLSEIMKEIKIGSLIPLESGHNGVFSRNELEILSIYLLNSKFI